MSKAEKIEEFSGKFNKSKEKVEELFEESVETVKGFGIKDPEEIERMAIRQTEARLIKIVKSFEKNIDVL